MSPSLDGKPSKIGSVSLQSKGLIQYSVDKLELMKGNVKDDLYHLWGWSFITTDQNLSTYEIYIVLQSDQNEYFFLTNNSERPDVQEAYKATVAINLFDSGFTTIIANNELQNGTYNIGILYKDKFSGVNYYQSTNKKLVKTPSDLQLKLK